MQIANTSARGHAWSPKLADAPQARHGAWQKRHRTGSGRSKLARKSRTHGGLDGEDRPPRPEKEDPQRILRLEPRQLRQVRLHPAAAADRQPPLPVRVDERLPRRMTAAARAGARLGPALRSRLYHPRRLADAADDIASARPVTGPCPSRGRPAASPRVRAAAANAGRSCGRAGAVPATPPGSPRPPLPPAPPGSRSTRRRARPPRRRRAGRARGRARPSASSPTRPPPRATRSRRCRRRGRRRSCRRRRAGSSGPAEARPLSLVVDSHIVNLPILATQRSPLSGDRVQQTRRWIPPPSTARALWLGALTILTPCRSMI